MAFEECARVLKTGGKIMWSVPFIPGSANNMIRAQIKNEEINHIMPPEYHGDPLSSDGVLCFQYFGWEMLNQIRNAALKMSMHCAIIHSDLVTWVASSFCFLQKKNLEIVK